MRRRAKMKRGGYVKDYYYMFQIRLFLPASGYENGPEAQSFNCNGFPLQGLYNLSPVA